MVEILQVIISIVVIYVIFSSVVFTLVEWISNIAQLRGKLLKNSVVNLFPESEVPQAEGVPKETFGEAIYNHPTIASLHRPDGKLTSYIPASNFAQAVISVVTTRYPSDVQTDTYASYMASVRKIPEGKLKTLLTSLSPIATNGNIQTLTLAIEKWFDACMDRASGWYKRQMNVYVLIVSTIVTIGFNIDTIHIIRTAKGDPVLRQHLNALGDQLLADSAFVKEITQQRYTDVDYYDEYVNDSSIQASDTTALQALDSESPVNKYLTEGRLQQIRYVDQLLSDASLPIGWPMRPNPELLFLFLGWLMTALALTAGAPFWFDTLKKLVNLRGTGPKPATK